MHIKQSQSQVCSGGPLSQSKGSGKGFGDVILSQAVVHPKESLLLGVLLIPCHKDVIICLSWNPR
jgi:hypothetical protein